MRSKALDLDASDDFDLMTIFETFLNSQFYFHNQKAKWNLNKTLDIKLSDVKKISQI